ncbi:MAG TPA: uracil-DNA glycosylase [Candidatus Omnitrophota bacterium]|nr:uracil-DNA glycosylase [Candidatus Omnitrophota bacterium]
MEHLYIPDKSVQTVALPEKNKSGKANVANKPETSIEKDSVRTEMLKLHKQVMSCTQCPILVKNCTKVVFGSGNIHAKIVFVGEAPGADEDIQGLPFVGRAGQLLTKIIEAMGFKRDEVFICNVLKCRPPNNRPPAPDEVVNCRPYLKRQLELIKPKVVVALGNHAVHALLQTEQGISSLRGTFQEYEGIPVMCTYHPAYLLRSPGEKRKVWDDMKKVMKRLEEAPE